MYALSEGGQKTRDITTCDFTFVVSLLAQRGFSVPIPAVVHGFSRHRPHRCPGNKHFLDREAASGIAVALNTSNLVALSCTAGALPEATSSTEQDKQHRRSAAGGMGLHKLETYVHARW